MATLEDALQRVAIGGSIEQTIWTQHPQGIEPQDGVEYHVKVVITKTGDDSHRMEQYILSQRNVTPLA